MTSQTQKIVNNFVAHFNDLTEEVSLNDMKKILTDFYKAGSKKSATKDHSKPKKEPSQYNIFMKAEMQKLKESGSELNATERMKKIAELWKSKNAGESKEVIAVEDKPKEEEVKLPEQVPDEETKSIVEEPKKKKVVTKK